MLFPILLTMIMGLWDMGNAMVANQRTITAAQVVADLIARERSVSDGELANYITAGRLALGDGNMSSYGVDILSVEYDNRGNASPVWRETRGMSPDANAIARAKGLGGEGEGAVVVTVTFSYTPLFTKMFTGKMDMKEQAFLRGRKAPIVQRDT